VGDVEQGREHRRAQWLRDTILPLEPWLRQWLAGAGWRGIDHDDVVQECFVRLLQTETVAHITSPRAYLAQTARSILYAHHRHALALAIESVPDMDVFELATDDVPQDIAYDDRCALERISAAVDRLPPRRREVLVLRRLNGLPQRATAEHLGLSESMVEKHLRQAMRDLKIVAGEEHELATVAAAA
jgi:RNA polymerase sigma factor (sigma-70 family)